jgi:two-component system, NarL family, response regulator NreC
VITNFNEEKQDELSFSSFLSRPKMPKIKILLADNYSIIRDRMRALLETEDDIEIVGEASDGKEAIKKVKELSPEIVIMDEVMPQMDGLDATYRITKQYRNTRVLILTRCHNAEYLLSAIRAGSSGCIPKRTIDLELAPAIRAVYRGDPFLCPSAATALINEYRGKPQPADPFDCLTPTEKEILKLTAEGLPGKEISSRLTLSLKKVMGYRTKIMEFLHLKNRAELIKFTLRKGLIKSDI